MQNEFDKAIAGAERKRSKPSKVPTDPKVDKFYNREFEVKPPVIRRIRTSELEHFKLFRMVRGLKDNGEAVVFKCKTPMEARNLRARIRTAMKRYKVDDIRIVQSLLTVSIFCPNENGGS